MLKWSIQYVKCWGSPMRVERNVMGGLLAIIAIGFVAIVVGGFLS